MHLYKFNTTVVSCIFCFSAFVIHELYYQYWYLFSLSSHITAGQLLYCILYSMLHMFGLQGGFKMWHIVIQLVLSSLVFPVVRIFLWECAAFVWKYFKNMQLPSVAINSIIFFQEEELKKSVLCIFANKQDIEGAMSVTEVASALGLSAIKTRRYQIFKTSAVKGEGLDEAMEW